MDSSRSARQGDMMDPPRRNSPSSLVNLKKIAACAVAIVLGLVIHPRAAELVEEQWSTLFPHHTAIIEKFGAPIRERFSESDTMRAPTMQMPVPAPGRKVTPSLADPKE